MAAVPEVPVIVMSPDAVLRLTAVPFKKMPCLLLPLDVPLMVMPPAPWLTVRVRLEELEIPLPLLAVPLTAIEPPAVVTLAALLQATAAPELVLTPLNSTWPVVVVTLPPAMSMPEEPVALKVMLPLVVV